uniref:Tetratricopeptide repeat domain 9B n=1 Tax=Sus scrofa TaxID=9823 RepID=A0A8D0YGC5_PIG
MQRGALSPVLMLSAAPEPPPRPPPALSPPGPGPRHGSARSVPAPEPSGGLGAALDSSLRAAVAFKAEGQRCYREKKFREAIGKYHRALLQLKAAQGARPGGLPASTSGPATSPGPARLSEEQRRLVENTEVECYDSLTGTGPSGAQRVHVRGVGSEGQSSNLGGVWRLEGVGAGVCGGRPQSLTRESGWSLGTTELECWKWALGYHPRTSGEKNIPDEPFKDPSLTSEITLSILPYRNLLAKPPIPCLCFSRPLAAAQIDSILIGRERGGSRWPGQSLRLGSVVGKGRGSQQPGGQTPRGQARSGGIDNL